MLLPGLPFPKYLNYNYNIILLPSPYESSPLGAMNYNGINFFQSAFCLYNTDTQILYMSRIAGATQDA